MGAELRRYHSWNGYLCFLFRQPRGPEQALAKGRCQDADCERLIGVNVYGSGARLVSIDLAAYNCLAADSGSARPLIDYGFSSRCWAVAAPVIPLAIASSADINAKPLKR
jgi:hypothetical protein